MGMLVKAKAMGPGRLRVPTSLDPKAIVGDARAVGRKVEKGKVDLIVTSPPYWLKRDYGHEQQLGQERRASEFVDTLVDVVDSWRPLLRPHGSLFINLGDSVRDGVMVGITTMFESAMVGRGWSVSSRILWAKTHGLPDPHGRLPQRYEFIFQFSQGRPFVDAFAYGQEFDLSEGNIWNIRAELNRSEHVAPFPRELPRRAILLACPERVCAACGKPLARQLERGLTLNSDRKQSVKAMERWTASGLTDAHLRAIRATGICDAGKARKVQNGAGGNTKEVARLAEEAKAALGGYFREFTFALQEQVGWQPCSCGEPVDSYVPGLVLDPFMGTGTTLRVARELGRRSMGIDLKPMMLAEA